MSNWTRAHDAHLARECEGWTLKERPGYVVNWPHYLTDPAAAIRAAEAWQLKDVDQRRVEITWIGKEKRVNLTDYKQIWEEEGGEYCAYRATVSAALAQALYRATGGPE